MSERGQLETIRAMRGIAALCVAVSHVPSFLPVGMEQAASAHLAVGKAGVDIFFVISGFVMALATASLAPGARSSLAFLWRRLARIAPLYWLVTLFLVAAFALNKNLGAERTVDFGLVLKSLLFIPVHSAEGDIRPVIGVGWSLDYEMYFYLCMAAVIGAFARHRLIITAVLMAVAYTVARWTLDPAVDWVVNAGLALEFLFGFLAVASFRDGRRTGICLLLAVAVGAASWQGFQSLHPLGAGFDRALSWGIAAFVLILGVASLEHRFKMPRPPLLGPLGDASYALYLTHSLSFAATRRLVDRSGLELSFAAYLVLALTVAIGIGWVVHRWIERPLTQRLQRASPFN